jgi:hypothetical protein
MAELLSAMRSAWIGMFHDVIRAVPHIPPRPISAAASDYCELPMRIHIAAAILFLAVGPVHADPARDALTNLVKCADITDASQRLACFDAATAGARAALAAPAAAAVPPAKEKNIIDWFGFQASKPVTKAEDFGKPAPKAVPDEVTEISSGVIEFAKTARGKALFVLDNGQVWRQIDGDSTDVYAPASGEKMKVTIEAGVFNSYNLTIAGRNGLIKVTRLK